MRPVAHAHIPHPLVVVQAPKHVVDITRDARLRITRAQPQAKPGLVTLDDAVALEFHRINFIDKTLNNVTLGFLVAAQHYVFFVSYRVFISILHMRCETV